MKLPLADGAYTAKSIIATSQRCINLYTENNLADFPFPSTHYLTPGTDILVQGLNSSSAVIRCTFRSSAGALYVVANNSVYYLNAAFVPTLLGTVTPNKTTPVSMQDNGIVILICDGTANLWAIDISSGPPGTFAQVTGTNIYGGDRVDYCDTFFLLNVPNTNQWYISLSEVNFAMLTGVVGSVLTGTITDPGDIGAIATGMVSAPGSSYTDSTYTAVVLTGGSGTGAQATVIISGGVVTSVTITAAGINYVVGDLLTVSASSVGGTGSGFNYQVSTTQGTYTNGTYVAVPFTGGTGSGAQATIVIENKIITSATVTVPGTGYVVGDVLSVNDTNVGGTGSGFAFTVNTIGGGGFDSLDIATKNGYPDPIQGIIVMHREIWIIGTLTSEIWYDAGAADFAFQILPGTFVEHGCIAKYSIAKQDLSVYWLSQDEQGRAIVIRGSNYIATRISTWALENEFSQYPTIADAIGFTYQQEGHPFYVLIFPTANKTWVFDQSTELWHERAWTDSNGKLNRHRMNCGCNAYNTNVIGDWQNGNLYALDLDTYTDSVDGIGPNADGSYPISRIRSWPAILDEGKRVVYQRFMADMQVGDDPGTIDGSSQANPPMVDLRFSDDRGKTYGNKLQQPLGALGKYLTNIKWDRLGMARGRVFELSWSAPCDTALNGAWVIVEPAAS